MEYAKIKLKNGYSYSGAVMDKNDNYLVLRIKTHRMVHPVLNCYSLSDIEKIEYSEAVSMQPLFNEVVRRVRNEQ